MALPDFFKSKGTRAEIYGYGNLEVGEYVSLDLSREELNARRIRAHISSHSQYYGKKFKTTVIDGFLHIYREA